MILTIKLPGGSLAQGYLISEANGLATINASGLILTGTPVRRKGRPVEPQVAVSGDVVAETEGSPSSGQKTGVPDASN